MPFYDDDDTGGGYRQDSYQGGGYRGGGGGGGGGYRRGGGGGGGYRRDHQPPLHTEKLATDRKIFFLDLKENDRGRVIKITEDVRGRRDTIMLPIEMLRDFIDALHRIEDADAGGGAPRAQTADDDDRYEDAREAVSDADPSGND
ncbi:MAG: hypothetical protein ACKV19_22700 [Verrucomicrobiales bacterium]